MDSTDGEVLHLSYGMSTELANFLRDDPGTSPGSSAGADLEEEDEESDGGGGGGGNPSGIGLRLECEDDKSYALPYNSSVSRGNNSSVRLHSSSVNMRISFSSPDLSCRYCKCNFLSQSHLAHHMDQFHLDSDSDCDDKMDVWGSSGQESIPSNAAPPPSQAVTAAAAAVVAAAAAAPHPGLNHSNGTVHELLAYSRNAAAAVAHNNPNRVVPTLFSSAAKKVVKKPKTLKLKRKPVGGKERAGGGPNNNHSNNPPLTLTIKKSHSHSEIVQHREAAALAVSAAIAAQRQQRPASPGGGGASPPPSLLQVKMEVASDSANEMVDVESSSPSSSPTSVKSRLVSSSSSASSFSLKKHTPGMPFTCDICMKTYVSKYALKRHIATHSDERPFVCIFPGCKGAFKLKSRLTDHVRYVHKRKTQRTVSRSKSLPVTSTPSLAHALLSPSSLSSSGLAPVVSSSSNGSSHHHHHHDSSNGGKVSSSSSPAPKTFKCTMPNCNREFRDSHNLRTHMCLHTGHMPLKCSHCDYRCVQKSALDWHVKSIHTNSKSSL